MRGSLPLFKAIAGDLSTVWIMATVGVCCGFVINQFRDTPLPLIYSPKLVRIHQAVGKLAEEAIMPARFGSTSKADGIFSSATAIAGYLDFSAFRDIAEKKARGIILDARPEIFHRLGHVPGAISLPREDFMSSYSKHRAFLEEDKTQPIAVYCSSSSCEDSQMVADALKRLAYSHVYVFKGGWSEWTGAHLPEEKDP